MKIHEVILCFGCAAVLVVLCGAAAKGGKAFEVSCQNNLKHVARMSNSYAADNDDYIVRMLTKIGSRGVWWSDKVTQYASNFSHFYCPADNARGVLGLKADDLLPIKYTRKYVSYGINGHISGVHKRDAEIEKLGNIQNPSYVVYFGDAGRLHFLRSIGKLWKDDYNPVHDNSMMAVMADGHTEKFNQENLGTYGKLPGWKRDQLRWRNWKE